MSAIIIEIYSFLLEQYGPQGWWPLMGADGQDINGLATLSGYHPGNYDLPENEQERFEICLGAILTQNTAWINVEKAIRNLLCHHHLAPQAIRSLDLEELKKFISPAGYYNQKAKKIKIFTDFFCGLGQEEIPKRENLLNLWGIGPETADSILLYAYKNPSFIVDAYTRRIYSNLGLINEKNTYNEVKTLFENHLPKDLVLYQEYHALLVEHAKRYYHRKADNQLCPLYQRFKVWP